MIRNPILLDRIQWLKENGFDLDPFDSRARQAELDGLFAQEKEDIFVAFPYGHEIIGSIENPGPPYIFAKRGCGKTALRLYLQNFFDKSLKIDVRAPILTVTYCDFITVLEKAGDDPARVKTRDHVEQVITLIIEKLFKFLNAELDGAPGFLTQKLEDPEKRKLFTWYLKQFSALYPWQTERLIATNEGIRAIMTGKAVVGLAKTTAEVAGKAVLPGGLSDLLKGVLDEIQLPDKQMLGKEQVSPRRQLEDILAVCQQFGYAGIYVLVDNVDQAQEGNQDYGRPFQMINPLASAYHLLNIPSIVFKFFLPVEIREQCKGSLRLDLYDHREITWDRESLSDCYQRRLAACWKGHERRSRYSIVDLCDENEVELKEIDNWVIDYACSRCSPRAIISLGHHLLAEHFRRHGRRAANDKINLDTWRRALAKVEEMPL